MGYDPSAEKASRFFAVGFNMNAVTDTTAFNSEVNSGLTALLSVLKILVLQWM